MGSGFSSDILRNIYNSAVKQGFKPLPYTNNGHIYLACPHPRCVSPNIAFSITGRGYHHEVQNQLAQLRRHAFNWRRTAKHTSPLYEKQKQVKAA